MPGLAFPCLHQRRHLGHRTQQRLALGLGQQRQLAQALARRVTFVNQEASPGLKRGGYRLWARCTNADGATQAMTPIWNPGGYM